MKRSESIKRKNERRTIETLANQPELIESDAKVLNKLLAGKSYDNEDITKCAKILLTEYGYNFDQQFRLVESIQKFDNVLQEVELQQQKPLFVIFGKPTNRWVLFCVISSRDDKNKICYKDPNGALISSELEIKLNDKFGNPELIAHTNQDQDTDDEHSYGPLCIRNLKIMLNLFKENPTKFVNEFSQIAFAQPTTIKKEQLINMIKLTNQLAENKDFKTALKAFIDKLPLDIGHGMLEYMKLLDGEFAKKDEEHIDYNKITEARMRYLNPETVNQLQIDYKLNAKDKEVKEYELEIQTSFPDEMKSLSVILQVLDDIKVDQQLYDVLKNISEKLDIDYVKMKSFYELKLKKEGASQNKKLIPDNIDDIAKNLPPSKEISTSDNTDLNQLLSKITLGIDQIAALRSQPFQEDINHLKTKYYWVKTKYEQWNDADIQAVNKWAVAIKGSLGVSDDDICQTIAIMDRALYLLKGGHRLRDTQILAVLIFFHSQSNQGRLCQIETGEGKTVIISLIAVIRALQGVTVDVITSNPIIAANGVDETKTFYSTFNLTVSTNNPEKSGTSDSKNCYTADVLYGTISNFQFDYLKDSFEGFNIRNERKFGQVILDEVDSMLVDNGGQIAKLASPHPGMESLRYIYIKIWQQLCTAEKSLIQEREKKAEESSKNNSDKEEPNLHYEKFVAGTSERDIIKQKIRDSNPTDVCLIPTHLKDYVKRKLDLWINNALHAKYNCHEYQQYRITTNDSGERVITPVDYLNTGVTLKNTIWSNGLHQFVQLKHNLFLTFESLTSSFISNIAYIKNYEDKNIFGVTGTLGSKTEQELLSGIYNITYAKLPTYKQKKFEEISGVIIDDSCWDHCVTKELIKKIEETRAVLVICETEQDLLTVKKNLEISQNTDFRIRIYANEDNVKETMNKVKIGDIILATNIAGRGTNFRTEKDLEEKGGLHVCVTFLPCNLRVENQAFGRTSRQGNNGTAQLIIRRSEVAELGIFDDNPDFTKIKQERDRLERERLEQIKEVLVKEINFKDEIFQIFSDYYRALKESNTKRDFVFVLQDLKEFWAFWLEKKNFKASTIINTTPKQEFAKFIQEAVAIIEGRITHNPFYCIGLANHYLEENCRKQASEVLKHAVEMSGSVNNALLSGLHLKLFELAIMDGEQVMERIKTAMFNVFFISVSKNEHYKDEALIQLKRAKAAIEKEIHFIEAYLTVDENKRNPDFINMVLVHKEENLFLKHIYSRLYCLKLHSGNIEHLIKQIEEATEGLDFDGKTPTTLKNFGKMSVWAQLKTTKSVLTELHSIGIDTIYSLSEIHDVPNVVINAARTQILGGIAALCVGLCFQPMFSVMQRVAGTLISEGLMDIVTELLSKGCSEFDEKAFMKRKFFFYAAILISSTDSPVSEVVKILSKVISFCRELSPCLRTSTYLPELCKKLADLIDKYLDVLIKQLIKEESNKLTKAEQPEGLTVLKETDSLNKFDNLGGSDRLSEPRKLKEDEKLKETTGTQLLPNFVKYVTTDTTKSVTEEKATKQLLCLKFKDNFERSKKILQESVSNSAKSNQRLMQKLRTNSTDSINETVKRFLEADKVKSIEKEIAFKLSKLFENKIIDSLTEVFDTTKSTIDFEPCQDQFVSYLDNELQEGNCKNDVDQIVEEISSKLADSVVGLWYNMKGTFSELHDVIERHLDYNLKKVCDEKESIVDTSSSTGTPVNNAYSILGLQSTASLSEIKQKFQKLNDAYQELVKKHDVDRSQLFYCERT
jgi:preprotein translocase subunit SecA